MSNFSISNVSNGYYLLLGVLAIFVLMLLIFKIGNWLENIAGKDKKKKEEKVKDVPKEKKEEKIIEEKREEQKNQEQVPAKDTGVSSSTDFVQPKTYSNYLYDRFVENPSNDDKLENNKVSEAFITEEELSNIRDRQITINVNEVEDISGSELTKDNLYKKIQQMANENVESKEKLLKEFENLPREMKLLLIENIMQKM